MAEVVARFPPDRLVLWCPACNDIHQIHLSLDGWTWDGNRAAPTISPSILIRGHQWPQVDPFHKPTHLVPPGEETRCHSFVRAGRWEFLSDCTHALAGQTVPVVPLPSYVLDSETS